MKRTSARLIALAASASLALSACGGDDAEGESSKTSATSSEAAGDAAGSEESDKASDEKASDDKASDEKASEGAGGDESPGSESSGSAESDGKDPDPKAAGKIEDVKYEDGKKPKLTFGDKPFTVSKTQSTVVEEGKGDGEKIAKDTEFYVEFAVYNGTTGKEIQNAFGKGLAPLIPNQSQPDALGPEFEGKKPGDTVAIAIPYEEHFPEGGGEQFGFEKGDSVVYLMKVDDSEPTDSYTADDVPKGFPTVELYDKRPDVITMPKSDAPKKLQDTLLEKGDGKKVKKGDTISVHYTGVKWKNGKQGEVFDSSKMGGQPVSFPIGTGAVIKGWDESLVGKKVGDRVEIVIPPKKGYGKEGMPQAGIKGDDTLVFVVDIVDTKPTPEQELPPQPEQKDQPKEQEQPEKKESDEGK